MIELLVVMVGVSILIQILSYVTSTLKEKEQYTFIPVDEHCEVLCALEKRMP